MPRRTSPATISGELNIPPIDVLHASFYSLLKGWILFPPEG
jgi:hypothetical protein